MNHEIKKDQQYLDAAGPPRGIVTAIDRYRFKKVRKYLSGNSVLDIGPGRGDFLNSIKHQFKISGIDINSERRRYLNEIIQQDAVQVGNIETGLILADNSFDNVTCMEVLEHLINPLKAINELVRVSKKTIIITVPYNETIRYVLCMHCGKYTPYHGHLNSFNKRNIGEFIPNNTRVTKIEILGNRLLTFFPVINRNFFRAPHFIVSAIDRILNKIYPNARWFMIILEKS
ncbi:MAG: class I SAM-dependent methyltransferase [Dehalococcoidales bacterium]|nr:class I SAM-dependent methyltransferase [Dehalococcoidales bacterium]